MSKYQAHISLTLVGPLLTAGTGSETYGVAKSFHRDHLGRPVIPDSHIKGKIRMALEEMIDAAEGVLDIDIASWFGTPSASESYVPRAGTMRFSNFICTAAQSPERRSRVAIHHQSGTASAHHLVDMDDLFRTGSQIACTGSVTFFVPTEERAREVIEVLRLAFKWLPNLGAEKGVGFGRLAAVAISQPHMITPPQGAVADHEWEDTIHLRIRPLEPILVGTVKKRRTNFVSSEKIIAGSTIKGAIAAALNRAFNVDPPSLPVSPQTAGLLPGFEALAEAFAAIRISHAFPTYTNGPRPARLPISTVEVEGRLVDLALAPDHYPLINQQAPAYFVDWKSPRDFLSDVSPQEVLVTRTAVDQRSRRSRDAQLFTYVYLAPKDDAGKPIEWVCSVDFGGIVDVARRGLAKHQFVHAVTAHVDRLGKLNRAVEIDVHDGAAPAAQPTEDCIKDGIVVITLQTDAIMLNPSQVRSIGPGEDLFALYAAYWTELSGEAAASMVLLDFFAHQVFQGGYLYHRYLGAVERQKHPHQYRPYYLTGAGSTFVLQVTDDVQARVDLVRWQARGLDLPHWAQQEYGQFGTPLWQTCPFVPENGYGEITVNLAWHWMHQV